MQKGIDIYTIMGIIIAIGLAIISPSIPKISTSIGILGVVTIFIVLIAIVILTNSYLENRKEKEIIKNSFINLREEMKNNNVEMKFLKERFKTLEDLSKVKADVELLKGKHKK